MSAATIMVQGTASGVGKSTITIGLCRILAQKGLRAAPFKAQNISDNAHLLAGGRRMARSQAMAAAACGIAPHPDMNPLLLLPRKGGGCEVILNGESQGEMKDFGGPEHKAHRKEQILAAYRRLKSQYDVIVAEGAGGPVELNLRRDDLANMGFATQVDCPVLLVTDIHRGGMFAMAYGTLELMPPEERALVKGLVVNNFYGDPASFAEGEEILAQITQTPVLGVVPHMELHLEDEDSLSGAATQTWQSIQNLLPAGMDYETYQAAQFDRLAEQLRACLDMDLVMQILEASSP